MEWKPLTTPEQIEKIKQDSQQHPVIIYKHSTRCGISSMVLSRLERAWNSSEIPTADVYFLDLIRNRDISQAVAATFNVQHESPQVLVINQGQCVYDASHTMVSYPKIKEQVLDLANS
ncbi:MAG: bacillithiol system redox-active protein YtxJ [Tunicatimonas sp.]|uniref:bacillithiol system redox-active protein YtxJ n=1 Tax=Tunicatimonas sp. TaxID=1940096 RepID=UPI003C750D67